MNLLKLILLPISLLYGGMMYIRNLFFDWKILPQTKVTARIISIGNLSMGGTGKTPHVEWIVHQISKQYNVAILLRGYGRKTKGFLLISSSTTVEEGGDEAIHYFQQLDDKIKIAVSENRVLGAKKLLQQFPDLDFIILDDAYQNRYLKRDCNILLTEYHRPFFNDFVIPTGNLREFRSGKNRADIIMITKTPAELSMEDKQRFIEQLKIKKDIPIFFSAIQYQDIKNIDNQILTVPPKNILLITGIGNPQPLYQYLSKFSSVTHIPYNDHHYYTLTEIHDIHKTFTIFAPAEKIIVTTAKDAMRLKSPALFKEIQYFPWHVQEMSIQIDEEELFLNYIYGDFKTN